MVLYLLSINVDICSNGWREGFLPILPYLLAQQSTKAGKPMQPSRLAMLIIQPSFLSSIEGKNALVTWNIFKKMEYSLLLSMEAIAKDVQEERFNKFGYLVSIGNIAKLNQVEQTTDVGTCNSEHKFTEFVQGRHDNQLILSQPINLPRYEWQMASRRWFAAVCGDRKNPPIVTHIWHDLIGWFRVWAVFN